MKKFNLIIAFLIAFSVSGQTLQTSNFNRIADEYEQVYTFGTSQSGIFTVKNSADITIQAGSQKTYLTRNSQGSTFMVMDVNGFKLDGKDYMIDINGINLRTIQYTNNIEIRGVHFSGDVKTMAAISAKTDPTPTNLSNRDYKNWVLESFVAENLIFTAHGNEAIYLGTTQSPYHRTKYAKVNNVYVEKSGREFLQFGHVDQLYISNVTCSTSGIYNHGAVQQNGIQVGDSKGHIKNTIINNVPEYGILLSTCGFTIENTYISNTKKSPIIILNDSRIQQMKNADGTFDPIVIKELYVKDFGGHVIETATDKVPIIIESLYIDDADYNGTNKTIVKGVNGAEGTNVKINSFIVGSLPELQLSNYHPLDTFFSEMGFRYGGKIEVAPEVVEKPKEPAKSGRVILEGFTVEKVGEDYIIKK